MAQAASKTCEICVSGPGHNYCEQCDQLFCDGSSCPDYKRRGQTIDKEVEGLINTLQKKDTKNVQTLQSIGNELKTTLDKAKEQQKFYQDTLGIKDTTKLLQKLKQIKSQIDQIQEIQIPIMPSVEYVRQKVAESEIGKLFGELTFGETVKKEENMKPQKNVRFVFIIDI
ncbi:uncharacterized protein LOC134698059 [Mytilus trossulus]|uniref:uncharacterized protein LOC134698059 n=1 Tax=Mytilus trossulus TaxID=6551 RepID=UPI003007D523